MEKYLLSDPISNVFNRVCGVQKRIRSVILGFCSEITRYFNIKIGVNIDEKIDEEQLVTIKNNYPCLNEMNLDTFQKMITMFKNIRNVSAHLFFYEDVMYDNDVRFFQERILPPSFCNHKKGKITMYGIAYFLSFLLQKYNIWPFITSYFSHELFNEIPNKGIDGLKRGHLNELIKVAGVGQMIDIDGMPPMVANYLNDTNRRWIINIFFDIEDIVKKHNGNITKGWSFYNTIKSEPDFVAADGFVDKLRELRNALFHGYGLFDVVNNQSRSFVLDINYITSILFDLKEICLKNIDKYKFILTDIYFYAKAMLHYYYLRLVEITYKILDKRLLTDDKVESRINNSLSAYNNSQKISDETMRNISDLITYDDVEWDLSKSKFTDFIVRNTRLKTLEVIQIKCENGIQIGEYKSDQKEMYLCNVTLEKEYQNKICGKYLDELIAEPVRTVSKYIEIKRVEVETK